MPQEACELTSELMVAPVRVSIKSNELTLQGIRQFYIAVEREEWKLDTLCDLFEAVFKSAQVACP